MKKRTMILAGLVALGAVLVMTAPTAASATEWTPPPAEQEPALPAQGVEALTWDGTHWTIRVEAGSSEIKVIEPAQEILCGTNYGKPCGTTYVLSSTARCVMVQVDWMHGPHNSTDPWRCKPISHPEPTTSPSPSSSPESSPSPSPSTSSTPSEPQPSASATPTSTPTPTSSPSPSVGTSSPSTPSVPPGASAPATPVPPLSGELPATGVADRLPWAIGAVALVLIGATLLYVGMKRAGRIR